MIGRNGVNHPNTTDAIAKTSMNPAVGNAKHSAQGPMTKEDLPNAIREQHQAEDLAANKWKVAMIVGEGKSEDRPVAGSIQGIIFVIIQEIQV